MGCPIGCPGQRRAADVTIAMRSFYRQSALGSHAHEHQMFGVDEPCVVVERTENRIASEVN